MAADSTPSPLFAALASVVHVSASALSPRQVHEPVVAGATPAAQFLHVLADELCGRPADVFHRFRCGAAGVDLADVARVYRDFIVKCVRDNFAASQVISQLKEAGLRDDVAAEAAAVVSCRSAALRTALATQAVHVGQSHLADFDWSLRVVTATDKMASLRTPQLLLQLTTVDAAGDTHDVSVELSATDMDRVLAQFADIDAITKSVRA